MTVLSSGSPLCHFLLITAFAVTTSDALAALSINDGVNGGQCSLAGTWDAASKTCTLNSDVADSVQIDSPSVTLNCDRHRIAAPAGNPGVVVPMGSDGVTIYECDVTQVGPFVAGILIFSNNNRILSNTVSAEWCAIDLQFANDNEVSANTLIGVINPSFCPNFGCTPNEPFAFGIFALFGSRNIVNDNLTSAMSTGMLFVGPIDNVIADNIVQADRFGIDIEISGDNNLIDSNVIEAGIGVLMQGDGDFPGGPFSGPSFNTIVNNDITGS